MESLNNNTIILNNYKVILSLGKEKKTGSLYVKKGDILRILYFNKGKFAYAHSNFKGEKLLDVISSSGILSDDFINDVISNIQPGESIGKIFVQKGYLTPMQLTTILEKQQKEIFYSAIFMKEGEIRFFEEDLPENITPLNLNVIGLIREGLYKTNDRLIILSLAGNLNNKLFVKNNECEYIKEEEKNILEIVGNGLVSEIINRSPYDEFQTLKIISFLKLINVLGNEPDKEESVINKEEEDSEQEKDIITDDNSFSESEIDDKPTFDIPFSSKEESSFNEKIDSLNIKNKNFDISLTNNEEDEKPERTIAVSEKFNDKLTNNYQDDITEHSIKKSDIDEELSQIINQENGKKTKKTILILFLILIIIAAAGTYFLYFHKKGDNNSFLKSKKPEIEEVKEKKVIPVKKNIKENPKTEGENLKSLKDSNSANNMEKKSISTENVIPPTTIKTNKKPADKNNIIKQRKTKNLIILPNYLKDIRAGNFRLSAIKYRRDIEKYSDYYSILIEIDCLTDSVKTAYQKANFNSKMFIIPRTVKNKFCYALFWGIYPKRGEAEKDIKTLPPFFRGQTSSPDIVLIKKYL